MEDVYEIAYKEMVYNMIFDTINERYAEAQQESDEDKGDLFKAGRALAYWEVSEIIKNRLEMLEDCKGQKSYGRSEKLGMSILPQSRW